MSTDTIYVSDMTLRDHLAALASDGDIESYRHAIPKVNTMLKETWPGGPSSVLALPHNWRQIARYMHADAMLAARGVKA